MAACQVRLKTDERLGILVPCNRADAGVARVSCTRAGHVETLIMCVKCLHAIVYCEQCMAEDHLLVRASVLALS